MSALSQTASLRAAQIWETSRWTSCKAVANWFQDVNCLEPYVSTGGMAFPCGKCPSCIARRRSIWTHRILLEAAQWSSNSFLTLTYAEEKCPWQLEKEHLTLFLKRLRARWHDPIRYYAAAEYSPSMRPHFHLALFNYPSCSMPGPKYGDCPCLPCSVARESWGFGHTMLGSLEPKSARYIAGYILKKRRSLEQDSLNGRRPEFARMSLKPGIGADATWDVASVLMQYPAILKRLGGDVPMVLRHGQEKLPLGPYLRRKIRERIGLDEKAPQHVLQAVQDKLSIVFAYAEQNAPVGFKRDFVKAVLGDLNEQENRNIAARSKIKGTLQ